MSAVEQRCVAVADTVVPNYRHGTRAYSCGGHVARMWQAAYDGAATVLAAHSPPPTRPAAAGSAAVAAALRGRDRVVEAAWRDGFDSARQCLTDDEAFTLTEDVEHDAWIDSATRASLHDAKVMREEETAAPAAIEVARASLDATGGA